MIEYNTMDDFPLDSAGRLNNETDGFETNIILLGPKGHGKSTLANVLLNLARDLKCIDSSTEALWSTVKNHVYSAPLRSSSFSRTNGVLPVTPQNGFDLKLPSVYHPLPGWIDTLDCRDEKCIVLTDFDNSFSKMMAPTELSETTRKSTAISSSFVNSAYHLNLVDTPGIIPAEPSDDFVSSQSQKMKNLSVLKESFATAAAAPRSTLNLIVLVISAEALMCNENANYLGELKAIISDIDDREHLTVAITHASNPEFQNLMAQGSSQLLQRLEAVCGYYLSSQQIFIFENRYQCISLHTAHTLSRMGSIVENGEYSDILRFRQAEYRYSAYEAARLFVHSQFVATGNSLLINPSDFVEVITSKMEMIIDEITVFRQNELRDQIMNEITGLNNRLVLVEQRVAALEADVTELKKLPARIDHLQATKRDISNVNFPNYIELAHVRLAAECQGSHHGCNLCVRTSHDGYNQRVAIHMHESNLN